MPEINRLRDIMDAELSPRNRIMLYCRALWQLQKESAFWQNVPPPQDYQLSFHISRAHEKFLFSANKTGKTTELCRKIALIAQDMHPCHQCPDDGEIWFSAITWDKIGEVLWPTLQRFIPPWKIGHIAWHNPARKIPELVQIKGGHPIRFKSAAGGWDIYQSANRVYYIGLDEEHPGMLYNECKFRVADLGGYVETAATPLKAYDYEYSIIDEFLHQVEEVKNGQREYVDVAIWNWKIWWNKFITEEDRNRALRGCSPAEYATRAEGQILRREGLVYPEYDVRIHREDVEQDPRAYDLVVVGIDWGFTVQNPFAAAVIGFRHGEVGYEEMYILREHLAAGLTTPAQTEVVQDLRNRYNIQCALCDEESPASIKHFNNVFSPAPNYSHFAYPVPNKPIRDRVNLLRPYLTGDENRVFKHDRSCVWINAEFGSYCEREQKPGASSNNSDRPMDRDDHLMTCLQNAAYHAHHCRINRRSRNSIQDQYSRRNAEVEAALARQGMN